MLATLLLFVWVIGRVISTDCRSRIVSFELSQHSRMSQRCSPLSQDCFRRGMTEDRLPIEIPYRSVFVWNFFSLLTIAQIVRSIEYSFMDRSIGYSNRFCEQKKNGSKRITTMIIFGGAPIESSPPVKIVHKVFLFFSTFTSNNLIYS